MFMFICVRVCVCVRECSGLFGCFIFASFYVCVCLLLLISLLVFCVLYTVSQKKFPPSNSP